MSRLTSVAAIHDGCAPGMPWQGRRPHHSKPSIVHQDFAI
jgi:hypothetical protein